MEGEAPTLAAIVDTLTGAKDASSQDDAHNDAVRAAAMDAFLAHQADIGVELYPAQEEAILELTDGHHVILNTPTGSGKSLVATFAHLLSLAQGRKSYYTCPIKALVSEKFFALCQQFGAHRVGMLTGDASINRDAPIICCTAEVLANLALADDSDGAPIDVVMDEFHYYADVSRGVAWQLPLLTLRRAKFLLMSATLGDVADIAQGIETLTGGTVKLVTSATRPVPLDYTYSETPLNETLAELMASNRAPVYVVHFTQRDAVEAAQATMSVDFLTKADKAKIAAAVGSFRFDTPFGKIMRRFIMHGMGVHHAGLLPKYRLLVEKLAQQGLLRVIMGTDTLGVGINVPLRAVLFTKLCKYDGIKTSILTVRDFRQIAGRAGRKGFDTAGSVVCQAPEHVIDNLRAARKVGGDAKALRKLVKKKPPPKGYVAWDRSTFDRLIEAPPEPLTSTFVVDHHLMLTLLQRHKGGYRTLVQIIDRAHERPRSKTLLRRRARSLFRALLQANLVRIQRNRLTGARVVVDEALGEDFSLTHALSLFLLDMLPTLDPESPTWALDTLSLVESILEHPGAIIARQVDKLKKETIDALRAEGVPYEERIEALEGIEHVKPLGDFIYTHFNAWSEARPWAQGANVWPKSIVREMVENCLTFVEYVGRYGLERIEGVLLRYISQVYRALIKSLPKESLTGDLIDVVAFLRDTLSRVDASLMAEWSAMTAGAGSNAAATSGLPDAAAAELDPKVARARIRTQMHHVVRLLAAQDYATASLYLASSQAGDAPDSGVVDGDGDNASSDASGEIWTPERLQAEMAPYFEEYGALTATADTRHPQWTHIKELGPGVLGVQHTLIGPDEPTLWALHAEADLGLGDGGGNLTLRLIRIGP